MRRDMDLIRGLLLKLEAMETRPGGFYSISPHSEDETVEGEIMVTVCVRVRAVLREGDWNMAVVPPDTASGVIP